MESSKKKSSLESKLADEELRCSEVIATELGTCERSGVLIPGLPNEIAILCIARVSLSYHANLRCVSPSWRDLVSGRILSTVRQELSLADEWIYLWVEDEGEWRCFDLASEKWFYLPPMPNDNRGIKKRGYGTVDGKLFAVGGSFSKSGKRVFSKTVTYFDARENRWKRAADLNVSRAKCRVGTINNQLYAFGGFRDKATCNHINDTAEAYDSTTNTWRSMSGAQYQTQSYDSLVAEGKFREKIRREGIVYDAETDQWEKTTSGILQVWKSKPTVIGCTQHEYAARAMEAGRPVGNMEIDYYDEKVLWIYDFGIDDWREVHHNWSIWVMLSLLRDLKLVSRGGRHLITFMVKTGDCVLLEGEESDSSSTFTFRANPSLGPLIPADLSQRANYSFGPVDPAHLTLRLKRYQVIAL